MERLPRQTKPVNCPRTDGEAVGIPGNPGRQPTNDQQTTGLTTSQRPGEQLENQLKQAVIGKYSRQSSRPTTGQRSAKDRPMTGGQPAKQGDKTDEGPVVRRAPRFRSAPSGLLGLLPGFSGSFDFSRARFSGSPGLLWHLPAPGTFRPPASGTRHPPVLFGPLRHFPAPAPSGLLRHPRARRLPALFGTLRRLPGLPPLPSPAGGLQPLLEAEEENRQR